jgi:hypothetical protein
MNTKPINTEKSREGDLPWVYSKTFTGLVTPNYVYAIQDNQTPKRMIAYCLTEDIAKLITKACNNMTYKND